MGKGKRLRQARTVDGTAPRSGTQDYGVLFGAYFFVRAVSGQVVLQIGRIGFRRTLCLSPADARLFAHTFRECAVAARRNRSEILIGAGYPRPPAAGVDEDDWFAEVNEWGAKQTWVQPGEVPATAGVAVNNAHVFLVQPAPGRPDLPVITFITGEDAETVADLLDSSVAESDDIQAVLTMIASIGPGAKSTLPSQHEILEAARSWAWPPADV